MLILAALLACNGTSPPPAPPAEVAPAAAPEPPAPEKAAVAPSSSACVQWSGEPMPLSELGDEPRHHATAAWWTEGGLLAAWQVGKDPAKIALRTFDAALAPLGEERVVSGTDGRATHPQVAAGTGVASVLWTREDDGALRWVALDAEGVPVGDPTVLASGAGSPARYGDLSYGASPEPLALWLADKARDPAWSLARPGTSSRWVLPKASGTNAGGPGTARHAADGRAFATWAELAVQGEEDGQATLRLAEITDQGPGPALDLWSARENLQRTALAFLDGRVVVGWTRYPTRSASWGVGLGVFGLDGSTVGAPRALSTAGSRMLDLDAAGGVVVAGWEAPNLAQDREIWIQVFDAEGKARCAAEVAHPASPEEDARAQVLLRTTEAGVRGVLLWQRGPHARRQQVWGRAFSVK